MATTKYKGIALAFTTFAIAAIVSALSANDGVDAQSDASAVLAGMTQFIGGSADGAPGGGGMSGTNPGGSAGSSNNGGSGEAGSSNDASGNSSDSDSSGNSGSNGNPYPEPGLRPAPSDSTSSSAPTEPQLFRFSGDDGADTPSGRLVLRIPASAGSEEQRVNPVEPPVENSEPPVEPSDPEVEEPGDPSFFGEPISGKAVFVIDVSQSMVLRDGVSGEDYDGNVVANMSRLLIVQTELINLLRNMDDGFLFDIVWLAGCLGDGTYPAALPNTDAWQGQLVQCVDGVREAAIEAVRTQPMWYGTPTWRALKRACEDYPDELDTLVFLTDGAPFPALSGEWGDNHKQAILDDFPGWFSGKQANGCSLVGVHVGNSAGAGTFMQDWCSQNGAQYIHR